MATSFPRVTSKPRRLASLSSPLMRKRLKGGIASPAELFLGARAPEPGFVRGGRLVSHPLDFDRPIFPDAVQSGFGNDLACDVLRDPERPEFQERCPSRQRLAELPEQQDLRRAEKEKTAALFAVDEQLDGVHQHGLFLHLVENHEARAVIQSPNRIGSQPEPLVGVIEGEIDRRRLPRTGEKIAHQRGLAGLAGSGKDGDGPPFQTRLEQGEDSARVELP